MLFVEKGLKREATAREPVARMSRHSRFERDFCGGWERWEWSSNGNHMNTSNVNGTVNGNGNNRPGLLPLPIVPSRLPTPTSTAATTVGSDAVTSNGSNPASASASKVRSFKLLSNYCMRREHLTTGKENVPLHWSYPHTTRVMLI